MFDFLDRTEKIIGESGLEKLASSHVLVFGVGGVGGALVEALVRAGLGEITLVDGDIVDISNLNRQILTTRENIGIDKVVAAKERAISINPHIRIHAKKMFFLSENEGEFDFSKYDYVADCVDTVSAKLSIVCASKAAGVPVISAMGAGNKMNPSGFMVSDIYETSVCPLAKVMRKELRQRGVESLLVVYSREEPRVTVRPPGSMSFVPPVMGYIMAGEIIKNLTEFK